MPRSLAVEILSAIVSASRARADRHDDAPDSEREFDVGEFDCLEISGPVDVEVETGGRTSVSASGPEWALDLLAVEHTKGGLFIGCDGDCDGEVSVTITVPQLRSVRTA